MCFHAVGSVQNNEKVSLYLRSRFCCRPTMSDHGCFLPRPQYSESFHVCSLRVLCLIQHWHINTLTKYTLKTIHNCVFFLLFLTDYLVTILK
ncbi:hypothetical protein GDO86_006286 [Hymenochirus boettgeri]|uniref:Uncharacterized protein n=1 Tax=Hymenochirus boettgeri TaxID=247094 RepID=A0A8T2JAY3_9PIPI|nr:hypothetical protein GDO86_006286 [Hymenochirus boettgeri]